MDKNALKTIIGEKHHEIAQVELVKRPVIYEDSMSYVNVGIRRAGKSWLLYQDEKQRIADSKISIEDCLYINFEDERIAGITSQELGQFLDCYQEMFGLKKPLVYLDEIQNIDGWKSLYVGSRKPSTGLW